MSRGVRNLLTILAIAILAAVGKSAYQWYDSRQADLSELSQSWPSVNGLIVQSQLEVRRTGLRNDRIDHDVEVVYEYVVNEQSYRNDVVRFDQAKLSVSTKELLVSTYPVNRTVTVYYNPDKPGQSVLVPGSYP